MQHDDSWPWAAQFAAETTYLNTASMGLPPAHTMAALGEALRQWSAGRANAPDFDHDVSRARALYADLVHISPSRVAVGHQVSPLVGLVAASLPDGARVLTVEGEFTSVTFPFMAHRDRGISVAEVPLTQLVDSVTADTAVVAVSAVQSADGALAPLAELATLARKGTKVLLDLTQAAGWLDVDATQYTWTVCGGYKWLLSPRGSAFLTVADNAPSLKPLAAGWYAGEDRWNSIYGLPLRLAEDARRFDASPAWHTWVGTRASLEFISGIRSADRQAHALLLARAFCEAAEVPFAGSAIVSLATDEDAPTLLGQAGVVGASRAGRLRLSFHVNNTLGEAKRVGALLRGHVWS